MRRKRHGSRDVFGSAQICKRMFYIKEILDFYRSEGIDSGTELVSCRFGNYRTLLGDIMKLGMLIFIIPIVIMIVAIILGLYDKRRVYTEKDFRLTRVDNSYDNSYYFEIPIHFFQYRKKNCKNGMVKIVLYMIKMVDHIIGFLR